MIEQSGPQVHLKSKRSHSKLYLLIRVEGVDVLDGGREQLGLELCCHPNGQRHPTFQRRIRRRAIIVHIIVITDLKYLYIKIFILNSDIGGIRCYLSATIILTEVVIYIRAVPNKITNNRSNNYLTKIPCNWH